MYVIQMYNFHLGTPSFSVREIESDIWNVKQSSMCYKMDLNITLIDPYRPQITVKLI